LLRQRSCSGARSGENASTRYSRRASEGSENVPYMRVSALPMSFLNYR